MWVVLMDKKKIICKLYFDEPPWDWMIENLLRSIPEWSKMDKKECICCPIHKSYENKALEILMKFYDDVMKQRKLGRQMREAAERDWIKREEHKLFEKFDN